MILVLSYNTYEQCTDPVIEWLRFYKAEYIKVNIQDLITKNQRYVVNPTKKEIIIDGVNYYNKINVVWNRRFRNKLNFVGNLKDSLSRQLNAESNSEIETLSDYLRYLLKDKVWSPQEDIYFENKLVLHQIAKECGLLVPEKRIINNKSDLLKFYNESENGLISKPMAYSGYYIKDDITYLMYTIDYDLEMINQLDDFFFPTLFQEKVVADYEIRNFYNDGEHYPTAILLDKTNRALDIKLNYTAKRINWNTYSLPEEVKQQLNLFMTKANLNTGSIDLIKDISGKYFFIEVNPAGQFLAPSKRCNYNIEKIIAEWLIKKDKQETYEKV